MNGLIAFLMFLLPISAQVNFSYQYLTQEGTPLFLPNFIEPEAGCNWTGVAGQVFDLMGEPEPGLFVKIYGVLDGHWMEIYTLSGAAMQVGPGGFEVTVADHLVTGEVDLYIQLFGISGEPVSPELRLPIQAACDQNLTLVNLMRVDITNEIFFPMLRDE